MSQLYLPSFLDRLTHAPGDAGGHLRRAGLTEIKDNVARDLEALLNTRHAMDADVLEPYPEARHSLVSYGVADFASLSLASPDDCKRICASIEQAIANHEPRLRETLVELAVESSTMNRLSFVIKAVLVVAQGQAYVSFDAMLQPRTLRYSIARTPGT